MKFKYNIITLLLMSVGISSCSLLGEIDDIQPEYVLTDGTGEVIIDETTADMVLNGVYASLRDRSLANMRRALGGLAHTLNGGQQVASRTEFMDGNITENNSSLEEAYKRYYMIINEVNSFLNNLELANLTDKQLSSTRKNEMIGEVRCLRALSYMHLLRFFGEYNDIDSKYGVVLYKTPVNSNVPQARSSVKEIYTFIMDDLDFAITNAPVGVEHWRVNSLFAKALKARMHLTMGEYDNAATVAGNVIDNAEAEGFGLEDDYINVFKEQFNSPEMLFAPFTSDATTPQQLINYAALDYFQPGTMLSSFADEFVEDVPPVIDTETEEVIDPGIRYDSRYVAQYTNTNAHGNNKYKYTSYMTDINSYYFMRLSEVYYIKAEAEARKGTAKGYKAARTALFDVIARAGYDEDFVNAIPDNRLLEMILKHKIIDLNAENTEEWFDLVRYHRNGDFDSWSVKQQKLLPPFKVTIFPIPRNARGGNNLLEQNPKLN